LIPKFESCLVCEAIRPELNGKLIILGFFGICPNVDVRVNRLDEPTLLTFLLSGGPGDGSPFDASFDVVDETGQVVVASTVPTTARTIPNSSTSLASTFYLTFGHGGRFAFRCLADGREQFRGYFRVSHEPNAAARTI